MRILRSTTFERWLSGLKDEAARGIIVARLFRLQHGLQGDVGPIAQGISELRIHHGPATASISTGMETQSSSCCAVGRNRRNLGISPKPRKS